MIQSQRLTELRRPQVLVENQITFAGPGSELSIYDTYRPAERVKLQADQLLYCGMISGRKIMHSHHRTIGEQFLPHESFVMAPGQEVEIDFPGACDNQPTTCLTIEISKERVKTIADRMNQHYQMPQTIGEWEYRPEYLHTHHATATQSLLERMVHVYTENHPDRELMIDLSVTELVVRMLRHQGRELLLGYCAEQPDASGLNTILELIRNGLNQPLDIDMLCQLGCMSRSRLYNEFNRQLGCTPGELQHQLRMEQAAQRLVKGDQITALCFDLGFSNPSHFSRRFKQFYGCSPREYRNRHLTQDLLENHGEK